MGRRVNEGFLRIQVRDETRAEGGGRDADAYTCWRICWRRGGGGRGQTGQRSKSGPELGWVGSAALKPRSSTLWLYSSRLCRSRGDEDISFTLIDGSESLLRRPDDPLTIGSPTAWLNWEKKTASLGLKLVLWMLQRSLQESVGFLTFLSGRRLNMPDGGGGLIPETRQRWRRMQR